MTEILENGALPDRDEIGPAGSVVSVGVFDGVHLGHRVVIDEVRARAAELGARSVLVTFEPHPLAVVRPDTVPPRLTTLAEKVEVLGAVGLDYLVVLPFTTELARLSPEEFVQEILIDGLGLSHLIIGYDHRFGRGRSGDQRELQELGTRLGFGTDIVSALLQDGRPVSSSRIREDLMAGEVVHAAAGLGRAYGFSGRVIKGDGRGRGLGFPTANLRVEGEGKMMPGPGVYAARSVVDGVSYDGVMHIGPRPTFPGATASVEVHLFDFDHDIYDSVIRVSCCERIRGIEAYESVEALVRAMTEDCKRAHSIFGTGGGACG